MERPLGQRLAEGARVAFEARITLWAAAWVEGSVDASVSSAREAAAKASALVNTGDQYIIREHLKEDM